MKQNLILGISYNNQKEKSELKWVVQLIHGKSMSTEPSLATNLRCSTCNIYKWTLYNMKFEQLRFNIFKQSQHSKLKLSEYSLFHS